jgi:tetratricopeptide (TPR) repeat protein
VTTKQPISWKRPHQNITSWRLALSAIALLLGLALALRARPLLAALHTNLGALRQAHIELALYDTDRAADPTLDEVRRRVDLSSAQAHYTRALALDSGHNPARIHLAQISLSRGEYAHALELARVAGQVGQTDWRAQLTLGDALIAEGWIDKGVAVIRGLPRAESRLQVWAWYRHWITGEYQQAVDAWQAVLLLNPENKEATRGLEQAEQKAKTQ